MIQPISQTQYYPLWRFNWQSETGTEWRIDICSHTSGIDITSHTRHLGSAPILRKEVNNHICATSLEFDAECIYDGEFQSLYTTNSTDYLVYLYYKAGQYYLPLWCGYLQCELYSEPDIAPPYDVHLIATDGLGVLKQIDYEGGGSMSVIDHIDAILAQAGWTREFDGDFFTNCNLMARATASGFYSHISAVEVNLDHMLGGTSYDALDEVLSITDGYLTQYNGCWVLLRDHDTEMEDHHEGSENQEFWDVDNMEYSAFFFKGFGSLASNSAWPVGQLSMKIEPAKNGLKVIGKCNPKDSVLRNSEMSSDAEWLKNNAAYFVRPVSTYGIKNCYVLTNQSGSYISQTINNLACDTSLNIKIKARIASSTGLRPSIASTNLHIMFRYQYSGTYYYLKENNGLYEWSTNLNTILASISGTEDKWQEITIAAPAREGAPGNLYISIESTSGTSQPWVYIDSCYVTPSVDNVDIIETVNISNNARGVASDIETPIFEPSITGPQDIFYGIPMISNAQVYASGWKSGSTSGDYLQCLAHDYGEVYALPRVVKEGTLHWPYKETPLLLVQYNNGLQHPFWAKTWTWDLLEDTIQVELWHTI